jgi:transposase
LEVNIKGTLHNGVSRKIAQEMGVHQQTVQRIWQDGQEGGVNNVVSKKPKKLWV